MMISTESYDEQEKRIDAMLREMVVEEGLAAMDTGREPKTHTLKEISEFIGVPLVAVHRVEKEALKKLKLIMLECGVNNGNSGI
jgi:DNA-directed RNA polymerase sigma subunit (sigma70/sigma32)